LKGGAGSAAYAASKAGVIGKTKHFSVASFANCLAGLTRALAAELGERNVRVNVILPGYIKTGMTDGEFIP
jgi:NAD(P)-dependent dehydrogenase (short-subunit alcohol dehydrogenase family)